MNKNKFKKDKYRELRGGYSRFFNIFCHHCGTKILTYQKDGSGELKRMYMDRIIAPKHLVNLQDLPIEDIPNLLCTKCKYTIAVSYIYPKEKRKTFRLFAGAITKKITK